MVTFRGSKGFLDWFHCETGNCNVSVVVEIVSYRNIKFLPPSSCDGKGSVHSGFQRAWKKYELAVTKYINDSLKNPIIITGHSRAGALAALAFRSTISMKIPKTDCCLKLGKNVNPLVNINLVPNF